jgi:hypothetical protein
MQIQPAGTQAVSSTTTPNNPSTDPVIQDVAKALGMTPADVSTALQQGTTLADLASQQGVSSSTLEGAIAQGIQQRSPGTTAADAQTAATRIANHSGKHHHHRAHGATSSATTAATPVSTPTPGQILGGEVDVNA